MFIRQHVYVCVNVYIYIGLPRTSLSMQETEEICIQSLGWEDPLEYELGILDLRPSWAECWASLVAQLVKNPPAMQETPVRFLGWEDPLEKG